MYHNESCFSSRFIPFFDPGKYLYETVYCGRGNMENRIKEQKLDLFSDRTSAHEWGLGECAQIMRISHFLRFFLK